MNDEMRYRYIYFLYVAYGEEKMWAKLCRFRPGLNLQEHNEIIDRTKKLYLTYAIKK